MPNTYEDRMRWREDAALADAGYGPAISEETRSLYCLAKLAYLIDDYVGDAAWTRFTESCDLGRVDVTGEELARLYPTMASWSLYVHYVARAETERAADAAELRTARWGVWKFITSLGMAA